MLYSKIVRNFKEKISNIVTQTHAELDLTIAEMTKIIRVMAGYKSGISFDNLNDNSLKKCIASFLKKQQLEAISRYL